MKRYARRPTHFAFGKPGSKYADSPCGYVSMWDRGLNYTRDWNQVSCQRCKAWFRMEAKREAAKTTIVEGTATRL